MSPETTNRRRRVLLAVALLGAGFLTGWIMSRHVVLYSRVKVRASLGPSRGDAPENVREGVLQALRDFQDGYARRDVRDLGKFANRFFPYGQASLVIGTEPGEWIRGAADIEKFIGNDWDHWGDVRLEVDAAEISGTGEVVWLATVGTVSFRGPPSPIRFTATLVRHEGRWVFRQTQFQWDNLRPTLRDHLRAAFRLRLSWR
jgi:hypothetical protein